MVIRGVRLTDFNVAGDCGHIVCQLDPSLTIRTDLSPVVMHCFNTPDAPHEVLQRLEEASQVLAACNSRARCLS